MRTQLEIKTRYEARKEYDVLGFEIQEYLEFMNFETIKPYLIPKFVANVVSGEEVWVPKSVETSYIKNKIFDYMSFAWGKANDCRGISANRSIMHMQAWLWLLGDLEAKFGDRLLDDY